MFIHSPARVRRALILTALAIVVGFATVACDGDSSAAIPETSHRSTSPVTPPGGPAMPGMDHAMPAGDGVAASAPGFRFTTTTVTLPAEQPTSFRFQIQAADGAPVTAYEPDQTKLMHFYLIRSDLTGFQHIHPELAGDGTWTAPVQALYPGSYRAYASFIPRNGSSTAAPLVLSDRVTVAGTAATTPLPPPSTTTQVDGYALALAGNTTTGRAGRLTVTVSKDGRPVTDLQPYLGTYAHLTAFHEGDLAFAHLHPEGTANADHGGPTLSFHTELPRPGNWRLFVQFQTVGTLHTAAITIAA